MNLTNLNSETSFSNAINVLQSLNIFNYKECQVSFADGKKQVYTLTDNNKDIFKPNGLLVDTGIKNNITVVDVDDLTNQ